MTTKHPAGDAGGSPGRENGAHMQVVRAVVATAVAARVFLKPTAARRAFDFD
jgi:hypothetical protein